MPTTFTMWLQNKVSINYSYYINIFVYYYLKNYTIIPIKIYELCTFDMDGMAFMYQNTWRKV